MPVLLTWILILCATPLLHAAKRAPTVPIVAPQWMVQATAQAPQVAALHAAIRRHAALPGETPERWARDVRRASWLPRLQLGVRKNMQQHYALTLDDTASVTSSGVVIGPRTSNFSDVGDDRVQLDVRMLWSLNELIFSTDTLAVHREARAQRAAERVLFDQAHQAYAAWIQATAVLLAHRERSDPTGSALAHLQQTQAQATLDGLTDGWFSTALTEQVPSFPRKRESRANNLDPRLRGDDNREDAL